MDLLIQIQNLTKELNRHAAKAESLRKIVFRHYQKDKFILSGINMSINPGEIIGLVGANGSGKTTFLKVLSDIYSPTSGTITTRGRIASYLSLGLGMERDLSVNENIELFGTIMGLSSQEISAKRDAMVRFSEMEDYRDVSMRDLSQGMIQRLSMAIVIHVDADITILDEMLEASDLRFCDKCYQHFLANKSRGKSLLFSSHNMDIIRQFCDKALLLESGRQVAFGPVQEVLTQYQGIKQS